MQQEVRPLMAVEIIEQLHRQFAILSGAHFFVVVNNRAEKTLRKEKEITTDISCHHDVLPMFLLDVLPRFLLKKVAAAIPDIRSVSKAGRRRRKMLASSVPFVETLGCLLLMSYSRIMSHSHSLAARESQKEAEGRMAPPSSRSQSFRGSNTSQMKTS
nr:uncharacterized protein LOC119618240 isoform X1 [Chlorocebus sabaeus]